MFSKTKGILTVVIISVFIFGAYLPEAEGKEKFTFKLASLAPPNMGWSKLIVEIIEPAVKNIPGSDIDITWYWGGMMGNDSDYIKKMKIGQLDGAAFTGQGVVLACPEMVVLELPFMFNDYGEVDYVREKMYPTFDKYAESHGYKLVVWGDQDFDQIYSTKKPMDSVPKFKNERFVTWYGKLEEKLLKTLGANPTPINVTEIASSVRQGVAHDMIAPAIWVVGSQLHSKLKYVNPVKIRYSPAAVFVTKKAFYSLPEESQKGILAIRDNEAITFCNETRAYTKKVYNAMVPKYVKPAKMKPADEKKLEELSKSIWNEMAGKEFPKELLDELLGHLADYRSKKK